MWILEVSLTNSGFEKVAMIRFKRRVEPMRVSWMVPKSTKNR